RGGDETKSRQKRTQDMTKRNACDPEDPKSSSNAVGDDSIVGHRPSRVARLNRLADRTSDRLVMWSHSASESHENCAALRGMRCPAKHLTVVKFRTQDSDPRFAQRCSAGLAKLPGQRRSI